MPLMDGPETIRAIRQLSSEVKIIANTGQAANIGDSEFAGLAVDAFLPKPFTVERILQVLRECFETEGRHVPGHDSCRKGSHSVEELDSSFAR
jgi:CheY-like chemotaxis protein